MDGKSRRYAMVTAFDMVILPQNLSTGNGKIPGCSCILSVDNDGNVKTSSTGGGSGGSVRRPGQVSPHTVYDRVRPKNDLLS